MKRSRFRISYVKKPFAKRSVPCLLTALAAFVFGGVSLALSVMRQGQGGLNIAAWGFASMLFSLVSLVYGGISFLESDMNYILSKIGLTMSGLLLVFWICICIIGVLS